MATLKTVLHNKVNKEGNQIYRLALRLTVNRKRAYYFLGQTINISDWNEKKEEVKRSNPKYKLINRLIRKKFDEIEELIFKLESSKHDYTAKFIIDSVRNNNPKSSFFELADEHINDLFQAKKHNRAVSDKSKLNRLKQFANEPDISFESIDEQFLKRFKHHLLHKVEISERSVMNIFVLIRLLYNRGISRKLVDPKFYPFGKDRIKIKYPQTIKIGLNEEEIRRIEKLELTFRSPIWHTRNIFLFSFYLAGIRISDVLKMKWKDIVEDRIYYKMSKNNKADSLKLPTPVLAILEFYKPQKRNNSDYIFPELKNIPSYDSMAIYTQTKTTIKKLNNNLSKIAELAEINKKITNHISRHSFGNIAGDKVSPQMLQKLYRHTHISTTIGYQGNFIHKDTDDALESVISF
ncbi:site-specific integrase [Formosa sp. L2A11]|uniref:site-specific integrase n=1 Tax=Formosa sp. L2A11 TaxID=2686363 RepID=UPI00131BF1A8|nr:site-specific integrase [Formosa sp. L2A11]